MCNIVMFTAYSYMIVGLVVYLHIDTFIIRVNKLIRKKNETNYPFNENAQAVIQLNYTR